MVFSEIQPPLLPDIDFDYKMNVRETDMNWLQLTDQAPEVLAAKQAVVARHYSDAIFYTPAIAPAFAEMLSYFDNTSLTPDLEGFLQLTQTWEPDFVIMQRQPNGEPLMNGASLCLPSSWNPTEKLGKSISEIHAVVPQLNQKIGAGIARFLAHFKTGVVYDRWFWGLAATSELDMHPHHRHVEITDTTSLQNIFVRYEHQGFMVLPKTDSVLFMIRPIPIALADFVADPLNAIALVHQLTTMPPDIQRYKGVTDSVKARLVSALS